MGKTKQAGLVAAANAEQNGDGYGSPGQAALAPHAASAEAQRKQTTKKQTTKA